MNQTPENLREDVDHDLFMENTLRAADFIQKNRNMLIAAAVAIILVVLGGVWLKQARETLAGDSALLLNRGLQYFDAEQYEDARPWLDRVREEFDGTDSAFEATYLLASIEARNANFEEARVLFEEAAHSSMKNGFLHAAAYAGLALCHEQEQEWEEAAKLYSEAGLSFPDNFNAPVHLFASALCYEKAGNVHEAKILLERILEKHEKSAQKASAEIVLKRIESMHE